MSHLLKHTETLVYYDRPQLIVTTDHVGTKYLCMLVEELQNRDKFLCVAVSNARLTEFRNGALDLLGIFDFPETGELYEGGIEYPADEFALAIELAGRIPKDWYPEKGCFLTPPVSK